MECKSFIPGSEWVYFKLYTGTKTADSILKNELYVFVTEMLQTNIIDKWFFIRYSDPDSHIRLRLHLNETHNFTCLFNRFYEIFFSLVDVGYLWNIQCDTYQREMGRYGVNTIALVEDMFFIDSEFAIKLLHQLNETNPEQQRWKLALAMIDSFLTAFSYDLPQRKELLNTMSENTKKEFGFTRHQVTKQLNDKCRFYRKEVENAMSWESETTDVTAIMKARRRTIFTFAEKLISMERSDELQVPLKSLITSMIHMTINRWFRTKNRLHELVLYEFLSRYYASETARIDKKKS